MNAIEARQKAMEQTPDLNRLYHVIKVEIKHQSEKGQYYLKKPFGNEIGFIEIVANTLRKEGFEVKILQEKKELKIEW